MEFDVENIIELFDGKIVADIVNRAFITVAKHFNFTKENAPGFPAFIGTDVIERQFNDGLKMYGYKNSEQIIGCVGYSYYKGQIYIIERLATLPEYRHLGIGKKLMVFAENKIKENGGKIAEVHVVDKNIVLIEWYKKLNYKKVRVAEIESLPFNSYVMNKDIS